MPPDLTEIAERSAAMEARLDDLYRAFREQVQRQEHHQEVVLKEISDLRQLLHTARALGKIAIWCGGAVLALISGLPGLIQWLHDHLVFKS